MGIRILAGGIPEPEELFGRAHLIDILWKQLAANNILLVAPRRFGKTGVMRHVLKMPRSGFVPVFLDAEDIMTPEDFATELLAKVLEQSKLRTAIEMARGLPKGVTTCIKEHFEELGLEIFKVKLREALGESWQDTVKRIIVHLEQIDKTLLIIVDEFPQMIENIARRKGEDAAREVVLWFRSLRMRQKDELRRLRFIIAGSTSIDMTLRKMKAPDKLNDFFRLPIEPITREEALELIAKLGKSQDLDFSEDAPQAFLDLIGPPVPYFIHLLVSQVMLESGLKGKTISARDVKAVYEKRLLGPTCHKYFDHYRQRLKRYGVPGERAAIAILRTITGAPQGRVSESMLYDAYRKARQKGESEIEFREIMADLECDWYVCLDVTTNEYFFFMEVMKAWWKRFYR